MSKGLRSGISVALRVGGVSVAMFVWGSGLGRILQHRPIPFTNVGLYGIPGFVLWLLLGPFTCLCVFAFVPHVLAHVISPPKEREIRSSARVFH